MGICSPAVVTADSHLAFGYAYYCVMNLWEFIWMHGIFHLMWSVWECREHHWFFSHLKVHSSALAVCDLRPAYFLFCSTFLRYHVSCYVVHNFILVNAQFCTFFAICIGLSFAQSIPLNIVVICIEFENHPKFRHITKFFYRIIS